MGHASGCATFFGGNKCTCGFDGRGVLADATAPECPKNSDLLLDLCIRLEDQRNVLYLVGLNEMAGRPVEVSQPIAGAVSSLYAAIQALKLEIGDAIMSERQGLA